MLDPKSFTDTLQKYNVKLKGTGPIDFHLGQSFSRNDDGEMEISAKCYIDKMIDTYVQLYGEKPRKALSPLEQNDHPELDDSPFLRQDETQQFQSLIGAMQLAVSIRRLDIATAVMSLCIWGCEGDYPYGHPGTKGEVCYPVPLLRCKLVS
jgi:hypothetical protein